MSELNTNIPNSLGSLTVNKASELVLALVTDFLLGLFKNHVTSSVMVGSFVMLFTNVFGDLTKAMFITAYWVSVVVIRHRATRKSAQSPDEPTEWQHRVAILSVFLTLVPMVMGLYSYAENCMWRDTSTFTYVLSLLVPMTDTTHRTRCMTVPSLIYVAEETYRVTGTMTHCVRCVVSAACYTVFYCLDEQYLGLVQLGLGWVHAVVARIKAASSASKGAAAKPKSAAKPTQPNTEGVSRQKPIPRPANMPFVSHCTEEYWSFS